MMKSHVDRFFIACCILLALAPHGVCAFNAPPPDSYRVTVTSEKPEYMLGENVTLTFTVENIGTDAIEVRFGGDTRGTSRAVNFSVMATDESGKEMPDPQPVQMSFGGFVFPHKLAPGERYGEKVSLLRYRRISAPGVYTIIVSHNCGWDMKNEERPTVRTMVRFHMPSAPEAEQLVAEMIEKASRPPEPGKAPVFVDFTTLQAPVYRTALLAAAKKGNPGAIVGLASVPTRAATEDLIELAQRLEGKVGVMAVSLLQNRLPPVVFPNQKLPPRAFPAEVWDDDLRAATIAVGVKWLHESNPDFAAVGSGVLRGIAGPAEVTTLIERLNLAIAQVGESRPPDSEIGNYPEPIPSILGVFSAMRTRAWSMSIVDAKDDATKLVFLDGYRVKLTPRPEGFETLALECLSNKSVVLRESALWAAPRPPPPAMVEAVQKALDDPDAGVQRAARFAAQKKETFTSDRVQQEQARIVQEYKNDPARMNAEMQRLMLRVADASIDLAPTAKSASNAVSK